MGLFSRKKEVKEVVKELDSTRGQLLNPRSSIRLIGFDNVSIFGEVSKSQQLNYFLSVPEVFQVITTKARMHAKMRLTVRSKQTGKEVNLNNRIQRVIQTPNWYQTQKEFLTQDKLFRDIYGNNYIYSDYPIGFTKKSTKAIHTLNPQFLKFEEPSGGLPPFMRTGFKEGSYYTYDYENQKFKIPYQDIIHLNNNNVKNDKLEGMSYLTSLKPNIENIIAAYESRGVILRNRGALGILSNSLNRPEGSIIPFDETEVERIQKEYGKYGLSKNQWQILITNLTLRWQSMAMSLKDMMVFEEIEADFQKICDAYGFKSEMFSTAKGSTFENAKQYEKQAYENTVIPEAQEFVNGLNDFFETETGSEIIVGEFDGLHIFNEDKEARANTIVLTTNYLSQQYTDGAITLEQYQQELMKWGIGEKPQ